MLENGGMLTLSSSDYNLIWIQGKVPVLKRIRVLRLISLMLLKRRGSSRGRAHIKVIIFVKIVPDLVEQVLGYLLPWHGRGSSQVESRSVAVLQVVIRDWRFGCLQVQWVNHVAHVLRRGVVVKSIDVVWLIYLFCRLVGFV